MAKGPSKIKHTKLAQGSYQGAPMQKTGHHMKPQMVGGKRDSMPAHGGKKAC